MEFWGSAGSSSALLSDLICFESLAIFPLPLPCGEWNDGIHAFTLVYPRALPCALEVCLTWDSGNFPDLGLWARSDDLLWPIKSGQKWQWPVLTPGLQRRSMFLLVLSRLCSYPWNRFPWIAIAPATWVPPGTNTHMERAGLQFASGS